MAEQFQDKTEAPTPRRREQARQRGQVARSGEVGTALLLIGAAGAVHFGGGRLAGELSALLGGGFRSITAPPHGVEATAGAVRAFGWTMLAGLAPLVLAGTGLALAAGAVQARGALSVQPLRPQWARLAPHRNLRRLVSTRPLFEFGKSLVKLLIAVCAVYVALAGAWSDIATLPQQPPYATVMVLHGLVVRLLMTAGLAFLLLGGADYAYQLWEHEKSLRMTREEVKRESKETDGDPLVKSRLRALGRSMVRRRMMAAVPTADVVVTNPTHVAVALKYDPDVATAPVVVAMGERKLAQRIKAVALGAGVPVVENKPLARALLATGRIGLPIPPDLYVAVAEVLAFVIRQRDAARAAWKRTVTE